jgi:hypothetical protein
VVRAEVGEREIVGLTSVKGKLYSQGSFGVTPASVRAEEMSLTCDCSSKEMYLRSE